MTATTLQQSEPADPPVVYAARATFLDELANADADERAELAALGVNLPSAGGYFLSHEGPVADPNAQTDAVVSQLQRRLIELDADRQRYIDAMAAEMKLIDDRYHARIGTLTIQYDRTEKIILDIASGATFEGKKKSRETPYGVYGRKLEQERVEIVNADALFAWTVDDEERALALVEAPPPKPVDPRVPHKVLVEYLKVERAKYDATVAEQIKAADGEDIEVAPYEPPPGVKIEPAFDKPFVKLA